MQWGGSFDLGNNTEYNLKFNWSMIINTKCVKNGLFWDGHAFHLLNINVTLFTFWSEQSNRHMLQEICSTIWFI